MPYIYIYIYTHTYTYREHRFLMFLDHTRHTTVGRTPPDERSAHRRDLYLTTHDTHNRQISMPPVGFDPRSQQVSGRRPLTSWDLGFESHRGHGYLYVVSVVCCQVEVSATSWSARPEESYRLWCIVCDLETSRIGAPYIYIYDISSLRVKYGVSQTRSSWIQIFPCKKSGGWGRCLKYFQNCHQNNVTFSWTQSFHV